MQIGLLDRRITLQRFAETVDEWNQPVTSWTDIGVRFAAKEDVSDVEQVRAAQVGASVTTRFIVRWDDLTETLTAADRIVYRGHTYSISGIKEGEGRRRSLEITAARSNDNLVPEPTP